MLEVNLWHMPKLDNHFLKRVDRPHWKAAMDEETKALEAHGTWELEDLPHASKRCSLPLGLCLKEGSCDYIIRYKAHLVRGASYRSSASTTLTSHHKDGIHPHISCPVC